MFPKGTQFRRGALVVVGDRDSTALRTTFEVRATNKGEPNAATIKVYNPAPKTAAGWLQERRPDVRLDAGYNGELATIFLGRARTVDQYREGNDSIVEIRAGDGEEEIRSAFTSKAVAPDTRGDELLRLLAADLGVAPGNLNDACARLRARNLGSLFSQGGVMFGATARQMDRVCASYGLAWSIQNGALQLVEIGQPKSGKPVFELSAASGLLGSPRVERVQFNAKAGKHTGETDFDCLLNPLLVPNAVVVLKSLFVSGNYRLVQVQHNGDTHGAGEWKTTCKARTY